MPSEHEPSALPQIDPLPRHVAIIMDGNGRWAKANGLKTAAGHRAGVEAIRNVLRVCADVGVQIVTLFAFSSENWSRPSAEVNALMRLFSGYLDSELDKLREDGVRVHFIGRRDRFSQALQKRIDFAEQSTRCNRATHLVIAVDYGGQWDIANAARKLAQRVADGELSPADIDESLFDRYVQTGDLAPPDLCIRTAGEHRISNFLLWQMAYTEFYFSELYWPDFDEQAMYAALTDYASRERRFGGRDQSNSDVGAAAGGE